MDIRQLAPDSWTALADRIRDAQALVCFEDDNLTVGQKDQTGRMLSPDEVRRLLTTLSNDMYHAAGLIKAVAYAVCD